MARKGKSERFVTRLPQSAATTFRALCRRLASRPSVVARAAILAFIDRHEKAA